jgi:hypothetical protein
MGSPGLSLLPSTYDIQRFHENIRQELSLADPHEGGRGDLTAVTMIAECVVSMIAQFCMRAKKALSGWRWRGRLFEGRLVHVGIVTARSQGGTNHVYAGEILA